MAKLKVAFSICHVVEETEVMTEGMYLPSGKEGKEVFPFQCGGVTRRRGLSAAFCQIQPVLASPPDCSLRLGKGWGLEGAVASK